MKANAFRNAATLALSVAFAGTLVAQSTPQQPAPTTSPQPASQTAQQNDLSRLDGQTVTVSGCLMRERDVPGQTPNVAERAGVAPDYVLTNVQMASAAPTPGSPTDPAPTITGGTLPPPNMSGTNVKLKDVDNDRMRNNLNKRVEITGKFTSAPAPATGVAGAAESVIRGGGPDRPLPQVEVTSLRVLNERCTPQ